MDQDEFLRQLSHEIRAPLTSIVALTETLLDSSLDLSEAQAQQALQRLATNARHLLELTNGLLQMADTSLHVSSFSVSEVFRELTDLFEPLAAQKGLRLLIPESPPSEVLCTDRAKLQRVLVNLLANAVKFTDRGHVAMGYRPQSHRVEFWVQDTGRGIPPDRQSQVFEPFARYGEGRGTGLGLAIARRLAQQLGGTLRVNSAPGQGSTFTLDIPRYVR